MVRYYNRRKNYNYYTEVKRILESLGKRDSLLDIGCLDTPVSTWGNFNLRVSISPNKRKKLPRVLALLGLWPDLASTLPRFSVITCLQVIEHVEDYKPFVDAIFDRGDFIIISLPWKWTKGKCKSHLHDPIDEDKCLELLGGRVADKVRIIEDKKLKRAVLTFQNKKR